MPDAKISELEKLTAVPAEPLWLVVVHNGETKQIQLSVALGN